MSSATSTRRDRRLMPLITLGALGGGGMLFVLIALWYYNWRPTVGTVVLSLGFMALIGAALLLLRAAMTFDWTHGGGIVGTLTDDRRLELEREKKTLLKAIKEIEFDQGMGKIDDAEANVAISRYRARAIEILRLLDEDAAVSGGKSASIETQIEKELARRLAKSPAPAAPPAAKAPDAVVGTPFCVKCGVKNDADAAFCKKCGAKLEQPS